MKLSTGVKKIVLDNGLTVLIKENHNAPIAAIFSYVKAGYFNESDRLAGISHLIEHMFFKGTRKRGVGQLARETKSLGGFLNASTIYDHTLYYTVLPSKNFAQGLDIQADALMNSIFDPDELQKETEVVIQEAKRKLDTPSAVATEKMFELAFEKHRMRRWRIGTEDGLRAFTREDFLSFYKNLYRPENIILVVVGDVATNAVLNEIEKRYADFEKGSLLKEESPPEPQQSQFKYNIVRGDVQQSYLRLGFHTPEIFHADTYALEILAFILGHGRSSRLFQVIKEEKELVHSISAYNYSLEDLGIFVVDATAKPENLREAEIALFSEIAKLCTDSVTAEELTKSRNLLESLLAFSVESVSGQASILASYEALGDYRLAETYMERLYEVSAEDVRRVAGKYLTLKNCSLLEYVPEPFQQDHLVGAAEIESELRQHRSISKRNAPVEKREPVPKPALFEIISPNSGEKGIVRHMLSNGLTLLIKENHQVPIVSMGVFAKGGRSREIAAISGISGLNARMLLKGTRSRTAAQIATEIASLGGGISLSNDPDYLHGTMSILSKNFESGWDIFADILSEPVFPSAELDKEKKNIIAQILRTKDDMFRYPLQMFYSVLFRGHAYGFPAQGREETVNLISREKLLDWHVSQYSPDNLVVSVVGDIDTNKIKEFVEQRLCRGNSPRKSFKISPIKNPSEIELCIEKRDKNQTALVLGFSGPRYTDEDYYKLTVLQNVLSGLGGRFFEELRSRQSLAYQVSTFLVSRLYGGAFLAYIATSPEKEEQARGSLLKEFEKLIIDPISEQELKQSIRYTTGTHQIGLETYSAQMVQFAHNELLGRGFEEVERFKAKIEEVTANDILATARKYFDLNRYAVGMIRGKKS
ncbi:MAG: insulinase family protein [Caldithrix sp.]|nr:MAG: insulinase family protein [Caldithrix sp.]